MDNEVIISVIQEIDNLRAQQDENLKIYGEKVSVLDIQVRELESKRDAALYELNAIKNDKEALIKDAKAQSEKMIEEARSILADAKTRMEEVAKTQNAVDIELSKRVESVEKVREEAETVRRDANTKLKFAEEIEKRANAKLIEAESLLNSSIEKNIEAGKNLRSTEVQIESYDFMKKELEIAKKNVDLKELYLKDRIMESDLLISKHQQLISEAKEKSALLDSKLAEVESREKEIQSAHQEMKSEMIRVKQINEMRSQELDFGFEKLKNDQASLNKEQRKVEEMKKELLKKGDSK